MTTILDTDKPIQCGTCKEVIWTDQPKVILGYGLLLIILHPECWEIESIARAL
jgi:hypothetical protein